MILLVFGHEACFLNLDLFLCSMTCRSSFHFFKRTRWSCIIGRILSCSQEAERSPLVNFLLGMDHVQRKQKVRPSKWDVLLEAHGMIV